MNQLRICWLNSDDPPEAFPSLENALVEPNGLLAAGGDLSPERILYAYRTGIFPWFEKGQPILWWSPDPRCVLRPERFHVSGSLRRRARNAGFKMTFNRTCNDVIELCSKPRAGQSGTWITSDMKLAYRRLHKAGWVHSVETWQDERLVGGIYGLASGNLFFGESMFSNVPDASKIAMLALCRVLSRQTFALLDCQIASPHLLSLGAELMRRREFANVLATATRSPVPAGTWPDASVPVADFL